MKLASSAVIGLLLSILATDSALSQVPAAAAGASLQAFLPQFEAGISRFLSDDPTLWKQQGSQRDDVTLMGAWGAYEQGWTAVGPRYDSAAARLRDSGAQVQVDYLASGASGKLAYTVAIERSEVHLVNRDHPAPIALRVTHIFRKEDGVWKLVHRHAHPLMGKTAPATVLQR